MKRTGRRRRRFQPTLDTVQTVLLMEQLSSHEHFAVPGKKPARVLQGINLRMQRAQSWGIYGRSLFEIKLLLEIAANIRPYHDGKCVLVERGMMRNKRIILEHVFYIGSATMLYKNMNVLEYLTFAAAKRIRGLVFRQEELFELLVSLGLGHLCLSAIARLTRAEKAVIILLAAACSGSMIVVFNLPEYEFEPRLANAIANIAGLIREKGQTLILGARDCLLIERACTHSAYLADGAIIYQGTVENLRRRYDRVLLMVQEENLSQLKAQLEPLLPAHRLTGVDGALWISDRGETNSDPLRIYQKIVNLGYAPRQIRINPKTVHNAYEEIDRQYDLQKQLFQ